MEDGNRATAKRAKLRAADAQQVHQRTVEDKVRDSTRDGAIALMKLVASGSGASSSSRSPSSDASSSKRSAEETKRFNENFTYCLGIKHGDISAGPPTQGSLPPRFYLRVNYHHCHIFPMHDTDISVCRLVCVFFFFSLNDLYCACM